MPHRFFVPPNSITPPTVTLEGDTARQIRSVLRLRPGDEIIVLDNSGLEWQVALTELKKHGVEGHILDRRFCPGEPRLHLTLYQGTLKGQKFERVLQKGTELGVSRFVPTICGRSVVRDPMALVKKEDRWQQIIREAAEQSGRGKLPRLERALAFEAAMSQAGSEGPVIMPWEEANEPTLKQILGQVQLDRIGLFIGPEGGFTPEEASQAQEIGAKLVTLGPRILRAETAGIAVCAVIFYELNEWRRSGL